MTTGALVSICVRITGSPFRTLYVADREVVNNPAPVFAGQAVCISPGMAWPGSLEPVCITAWFVCANSNVVWLNGRLPCGSLLLRKHVIAEPKAGSFNRLRHDHSGNDRSEHVGPKSGTCYSARSFNYFATGANARGKSNN